MAPKSKKIPTPDELLVEVSGQEVAKTYEFEAYLPVIHALQQKGYSYAAMAEFIKDRLGITASRGQVYRAYQLWLDERDRTEEDIEREKHCGTTQDEIESRFDQEANELIETLNKEFAGRGYAPWDDANALICRAASILKARHEAAVAAEKAAEEADQKLAAKKGK